MTYMTTRKEIREIQIALQFYVELIALVYKYAGIRI